MTSKKVLNEKWNDAYNKVNDLLIGVCKKHGYKYLTSEEIRSYLSAVDEDMREYLSDSNNGYHYIGGLISDTDKNTIKENLREYYRQNYYYKNFDDTMNVIMDNNYESFNCETGVIIGYIKSHEEDYFDESEFEDEY